MSTETEDWMLRKQLCNIVLVYSPQMLLGDQHQTGGSAIMSFL